MDLLEYQSKEILLSMGIPVPNGRVVYNVEQAIQTSNKIGFPVAVKAQVPTGKRGKAGGIIFADTIKELKEAVNKLLEFTIDGHQVDSILIEQKILIENELYVGMTIDPFQKSAVLMLSANGGMDIEEMANCIPESIFSLNTDGLKGLKNYEIISLAKKAGFQGGFLNVLTQILKKVEKTFFRWDATTVEINPLAITESGELIAADAKIVIDDSALFRRQQLEKYKQKQGDRFEALAKEANLSFVNLNRGNIGIIAGGAGLALCTMDTVNALGGKPMNFLDLGGGVSREAMAKAVRIVADIQGVKGILINVFGGINNCETMALGITDVLEDNNATLPKLVVKMRGHNQEEGWALLEKHNIDLVKFGTTGDAVGRLLKSIT